VSRAETCARSWEAEALEDSRLGARERAAFERHLQGCARCASEVASLAALRRAARALPVLRSEPLARRRLRQAVLRSAAEAVTRAPRPWRARLALPMVALAVLGGLLVVGLRPVPPPPLARIGVGLAAPRVPAVPAPTFRVTASDGSVWRTGDDGPTVRLDLQRGRFEIEVDKLGAGQRFLVDLPDGALEVRGTRFVLDLEDGVTRHVAVTEGRVALRLTGRGEVALSAGDAWPEALPRSAPAGSTAPAAPPSAHSAASAPSMPAPSAPPADASAGTDFAAAMAAFSSGDFGRAEQLFRTFEQRHPGDARAEDAAFLGAVARSRRGDAAGARALARDYLDRYPGGLRRVEAERLGR
jgi:hypothetical protein